MCNVLAPNNKGEFGLELKYIKGENIVVADALSFLDTNENQDILNVSEVYGYNDYDLPDRAYPNFLSRYY